MLPYWLLPASFLAVATALLPGSALPSWCKNSHCATQFPIRLHSQLHSQLRTSFSLDRSTETPGLYRKFADHALAQLSKTGWFDVATIPDNLAFNQAPAKGMQNSVVRISTKAMIPAPDHEGLVRYARVALLETVPQVTLPEQIDARTQHSGIQVLNFIVLPSDATKLPVLGIDLVSLPGGRHLLLLDAQPMTDPNPFEKHWDGWHSIYVANNQHFPWGGDFPEAVKAYVSKNALWTRLQEAEDPVSVIEGDLWVAYVAHLDAYITLLASQQNSTDMVGSNQQASYLSYRRNNDPAKPMLNSLYGSEWTNALLDTVLFPESKKSNNQQNWIHDLEIG
jgi:Ferredoxin-dependent bilin reductase